MKRRDGVRLYDVEALTSYEAYHENDCRDKTDKSVFLSTMQWRDVITMGKVIGKPIVDWQ